MSDDVLIQTEDVAKKFCRDLKRSLAYGVRDVVGEFVGSSRPDRLREQEFWAVRDVSFKVRRGECLGLIGRNGAGKTTLLKLLNGLIKPDRGRVTLRGQVRALIALGAGFNPILTARENIFVNGAIFGLRRKEIRARFEEIVSFAEIEEFVDAPVQSYSSGMQVRLGFAIAAVLIRPDVLLLDEVLAVGDAQFQTKCINVIKSLQASGVATVLVSHNMHDILRYCTTGLYLDRGRVRARGDIEEVTATYLQESDPTSDGATQQAITRGNVPISAWLELGVTARMPQKRRRSSLRWPRNVDRSFAI